MPLPFQKKEKRRRPFLPKKKTEREPPPSGRGSPPSFVRAKPCKRGKRPSLTIKVCAAGRPAMRRRPETVYGKFAPDPRQTQLQLQKAVRAELYFRRQSAGEHRRLCGAGSKPRRFRDRLRGGHADAGAGGARGQGDRLRRAARRAGGQLAAVLRAGDARRDSKLPCKA